MSETDAEAEEKIIRVWFGLVSGTSWVAERYAPIRLLEAGTELNSFSVGTLGLAGFPVPPHELPSHQEDIAADCYVCPVFSLDETTIDSPLDVTNQFHRFRKLLFARTNLPLRVDGKSITDNKLTFSWRRTLKFLKEGLRIPLFVAHYESKINPETGLWQ